MYKYNITLYYISYAHEQMHYIIYCSRYKQIIYIYIYIYIIVSKYCMILFIYIVILYSNWCFLHTIYLV